MQAGARTITGRRDHNEDALLVEPTYEVWAVADGMGGYEGGEIASELAVKTLREFFRANFEDDSVTWPFGIEASLTFGENLVSVAIRLAHRAVMFRRDGDLSKMGSTVAVVARVEDKLVVAHIGDSRVYRLRDGNLEQLTRDHSFIEEMAAQGCELGPEAVSRYGNVVTRALGFAEKGDRPDVTTSAVLDGDRYLLSTDGLHDVLHKETMRAIIDSTPVQDAAEALIEAAYAAGSRDNITAIVLHAGDS